MKVCPLCEFIYEDDQSLCDMDGTALVYDPAPRALASAALPAGAPSAKSRVKRFAATAATGVVLGTVLVLVFHVFTLRAQEQVSATTPPDRSYSSRQVTGYSQTPLDLALPVPVAPQYEVPPAPAPAESPVGPARQTVVSPEQPRSKAAGNPSQLVKDSPASDGSTPLKKEEKEQKAAQPNPKPVEPKHKDSGIGSFFKKTGRILKKPFTH